MHAATRLRLAALAPHLTCGLCRGYLIDATTMIDCPHSFCKKCIVQYLSYNKCCPVCKILVHKTKPLLNIRDDRCLQELVYKLVPGLFADEMKKRREFFKQHPFQAALVSREQRGEVSAAAVTPAPADSVDSQNVSLQIQLCDGLPETQTPQPEQVVDTRYLSCPPTFTVGLLKKFVRLKFGLQDKFKVEVFHSDEPLSEAYTLLDVAYLYNWRRDAPLKLFYIVFDGSIAHLECHVPAPVPMETPITTETDAPEPIDATPQTKVPHPHSTTNSASPATVQSEKDSEPKDTTKTHRAEPRLPKLKIRKVPKLKCSPSPSKKHKFSHHHHHGKHKHLRRQRPRDTDSPMEVVMIPPSPDSSSDVPAFDRFKPDTPPRKLESRNGVSPTKVTPVKRKLDVHVDSPKVTPVKLKLNSLSSPMDITIVPKDTSTPASSISRPKSAKLNDKTLFEKLFGEISANQRNGRTLLDSPGPMVNQSTDELFADLGTRSDRFNASSGTDTSKDDSALAKANETNNSGKDESSVAKETDCSRNESAVNESDCGKNESVEKVCSDRNEPESKICDVMNQSKVEPNEDTEKLQNGSSNVKEDTKDTEAVNDEHKDTKEESDKTDIDNAQSADENVDIESKCETPNNVITNGHNTESKTTEDNTATNGHDTSSEDIVVDLTDEEEQDAKSEGSAKSVDEKENKCEPSKPSAPVLPSLEELKAASARIGNPVPLYNYLSETMGQAKKERPKAAWVHRKEEETDIFPREGKLNIAIRKIKEKKLAQSPERPTQPTPETKTQSAKTSGGTTVKATTWIPSALAVDKIAGDAGKVAPDLSLGTKVKIENGTPSVVIATHEKLTPVPSRGEVSRVSGLLEQHCLKNVITTPKKAGSLVTSTSKPFSISELTPSEIIVQDNKNAPRTPKAGSSLEKLKQLASYHSQTTPPHLKKSNDSILQICPVSAASSKIKTPTEHRLSSPQRKPSPHSTSTTKTLQMTTTSPAKPIHIAPRPAISSADVKTVLMSASSPSRGPKRPAGTPITTSLPAKLASTGSVPAQYPLGRLGILPSEPAPAAFTAVLAAQERQRLAALAAQRPGPHRQHSMPAQLPRPTIRRVSSTKSVPTPTPHKFSAPASVGAKLPTSAPATIKVPTSSLASHPGFPRIPYDSYMYTTNGMVMYAGQVHVPAAYVPITAPTPSYSPYNSGRNSISTPSPTSMSPGSPMSPGQQASYQQQPPGGPGCRPISPPGHNAAPGYRTLTPPGGQQTLGGFRHHHHNNRDVGEDLTVNNGYDAPLDFSKKASVPVPLRQPPPLHPLIHHHEELEPGEKIRVPRLQRPT